MRFSIEFLFPARGLQNGILWVIFILLLISCSSNSGPKTDFQPRQSVDDAEAEGSAAHITSIRLEMKKPFPRAKIDLHIQGSLPDGCTHIKRITQQKKADTFYIQVITSRDSQAFCTQALVPFNRTVALDTEDLPSGGYHVRVQNLKATFAVGDR